MNLTPGERVFDRSIETEMRDSYIDYSMSVIVQRALPDVRDGLKPVHRRILFGMNELNVNAGKPYKKSARIVGDVMGKYHPHGDQSIYDALVRMVQTFSLRYPLVDGQGNFGSIDGDSAAAMRYTEARMERLAEEMLADIDKETVAFTGNYDDTLKEPTVLPAKFPNLLVNGSSGIAVGMATNIPPHNLGEVISGLLELIDNPLLTPDDLMKWIPAPDFPTAGIIYGMAGVRDAYRTGRGRIVIRARAVVESPKNARERIVVVELPFQVDKSRLILKIAELVNDKKIEGIADIRDESDRDGMRLVLEIKRDAVPEVILNNLYAHTQLQTTFGVILLALVGGAPKVINLKRALEEYLKHRHDVVTKRLIFDLKKALEREHILEGLKIAVDNLDEVIYIIRNSPDSAAARTNLMQGHRAYIELKEKRGDQVAVETHNYWELTEIQAREVLDMRLARLTGLERQKIIDELDAVRREISKFRELLGPNVEVERLDRIFELVRHAEDDHAAAAALVERFHYANDQAVEVVVSFKRRLAVIKEELLQIREEYADERRTMMVEDPAEFRVEDMIAEEEVVITVTKAGYIKRFPVSGYRRQNRGGRGLSGHAPREEDVIQHLFVASTHNYLLFFTNNGRCYWLKVHEIPSLGRAARGKPIINLIDVQPGEKIGAMVNVKKFDDDNFVLFSTRKGIVKKTPLSAYGNPRKSGIIAISIDEGDELAGVDLTDGTCDIVLGASNGKAVRFRESDIPPHGRSARGVIGMRIEEKETIVGMVVARREGTLLVCALNGNGKKSPLHEYRLTKRGAQGVIAMRTTAHTGPLIALMEVTDADDLLIITTSGMVIRQNVDKLRTIGRVTQGVRLIRLDEGDKIQDIARVVREEDVDPDAEGGDEGMVGPEEQMELIEG